MSDLSDLEYAARTYAPNQVSVHADACAERGCPSYIHCFFGQSGLPVCAKSIMVKQMDPDMLKKFTTDPTEQP